MCKGYAGDWEVKHVGLLLVFFITDMELPEVEAELEKMEVKVGLLEDLVIFCLALSDIRAANH